MPIQGTAPITDDTAGIIEAANQATAAPDNLQTHELSPTNAPAGPSKREIELATAVRAIVPEYDGAWYIDEHEFESNIGLHMDRKQAEALLRDFLDANLTSPDHRAPTQTLARLLQQSDVGMENDPFSYRSASSTRPYETYLAGLYASKNAAAARATEILCEIAPGEEVELIAIGAGEGRQAPSDWAAGPDYCENWFNGKGPQRVVVRMDDPAHRERAEAFIRAFFGTKNIYMRAPGWKALTEYLPRSPSGDSWLADLTRKAPSLRPMLRVATPTSGWAIFPADEAFRARLEIRQPELVRVNPSKDLLARELNAIVTDLIPVPFTVQLWGLDDNYLVRPKGEVGDEDPTLGFLIEERVLGDAARADVGANAEGKPARALAALTAAGAEFFNSPGGRLWVSFGGKVHRVSETDGCPAIMAWLVKNDLAPSRTAKTELFDLMAGAAVSGPTQEVHFRQAQTPGAEPVAYLNLMDPKGRGVVIDAAGWRVAPVASFPVRMADRPKARPLPLPERAGDGLTFLERFTRHVKLPPVINASDPADAGLRSRAAILALLVAQFYRAGAVPHMFLTGPEGASKTTTAKRLKALVDPDSVPLVTSMPREAGDLFLLAEQQPVLVIDNASSIQDPDIVAALATGAGHQKRQFYTDSERTVYQAKTSLIFTSIVSDITQRPDLMDRVLPVALRPMHAAERKLEAELDEAWSGDLPFLLADLLDLVVAAVANSGKVRSTVVAGLLPPIPRLADAAIAAEAASQAEGWAPGLLLSVLNSMRDTAKADQLEANPVAVRVRALLETNNGHWTGTTTDLLNALKWQDGPPWGREVLSVHTLAKALDRIVASLPLWGIDVTRGARSNSARTLTIARSGGALPPAEPEAGRAG